MKTRNRLSSILAFGLIAALPPALPASATSKTAAPPADPDSALEVFDRCHSILSGERPDEQDPLRLQVARGRKSAVDACREVLRSARLDARGLISRPDQNMLGRKVLRTFEAFHHGWFANYLTYMTIDGPATFDVVDSETPALFVTRALFDPRMRYADIVRGKTTYEGIRRPEVRSEYLARIVPQQTVRVESPKFKAGLDENTAEWSPRRLEHGPLIGIRPTRLGHDILPRSVNDLFFPKLSTEAFDIQSSPGGGLLGSNAYLIFNIGRNLGERSDGGLSLPRRWAKQAFSDLLCRDVPVINPGDVALYREEVKGLPWSGEKSCLACHASLDQAAGLLRGAELVLSRRDGTGSYHVRIHSPRTPVTTTGAPVLERRADFYLTPPRGRLLLRSLSGQWIDRPLHDLDDLGRAFGELDEFYQCATSRYLYFLTGIQVPLKGEGGTPAERGLRERFRAWAARLKKTQRLDLLVEDIIGSDYFRNGGLEPAAAPQAAPDPAAGEDLRMMRTQCWSPQANYCHRLGQLELKQGRPQEAARAFERACQTNYEELDGCLEYGKLNPTPDSFRKKCGERRDARSCSMLAGALEATRQPEQARATLQRGCADGSIGICFLLADRFSPEDEKNARASCSRNEARACAQLAHLATRRGAASQAEDWDKACKLGRDYTCVLWASQAGGGLSDRLQEYRERCRKTGEAESCFRAIGLLAEAGQEAGARPLAERACHAGSRVACELSHQLNQ